MDSQLYNACKNFNGSTEPVKRAILRCKKKGISLDTLHPKSYLTALHLACRRGHMEIVELLLAAGADPNKTDVYGWSPLFSACRYGYVEIVKLLMCANADVNQKNFDDWTPLYTAVYNQHIDVIKLLLSAKDKIIVDQQTNGETPCHYVSHYVSRNSKIMKLLVEAGADCTLVSYTGCSPFIEACMANLEIVPFLSQIVSDDVLRSWNHNNDEPTRILQNELNIRHCRKRRMLLMACWKVAAESSVASLPWEIVRHEVASLLI